MTRWIRSAVNRLQDRLLHTLSRRRLVLLCALAVALLALNGLIFYQNMRTVVDHDRAVRRSQEVLSALENLLVSLDEAETGERGYIITGDRSYLQPYTAASGRIDPEERQLRTLLAGDGQQQRYLPQLRVYIAAKLAEMQLVIGTVEQIGGATAAERFVLSNQDDENLMDQLRSTIGAMKGNELARLDRSSAQAQGATDTAVVSVVLATAAGVVLLIGIFALIQRDVTRTARIMAERAQLLSDEQAARIAAEDAVRTRETFLSLASHELRTPLTSLLGNAQLLQRGLATYEGLAEGDRRKLNAIMRQAQRLRILTEQLLDSSRLQHGQLVVTREPVDVVALARRVVEEAQAMTTRHRLHYSGAGTPVMVAGDVLRLEQVLQNLIANAIKYSPAGGPISVEVTQQDDVQIAVKDSGIGIPESAQPQLFERFYRAPNASVTNAISGLGIGLYVVKEVVAQHGGRVEVVSAEGAGSTFTIHLPLLREAGVPAPTAAGS